MVITTRLSLSSVWLVFLIVLMSTLAGGCSDRGALPDFAAIEDVTQMKQAFYRFMIPVVDEQNARIAQQREKLSLFRSQLQADKPLSWWQQYQLHALASDYEVDPDGVDDVQLVNQLWSRVDAIPADLAIAQAAKESGWGRSRFAVDINNLFGQWCYEQGCGVVPAKRPRGAQHEVEAFRSVSEAVRRYMNNLNTHPRYKALRDLRAQLRASGKPLTGSALAPGLLSYSERGEVYIDELVTMMRRNRSLLEQSSST